MSRLLSANDSTSPLSNQGTSRWSEVRAIYRRICLLRSRGRSLEAARLQSTELSLAVGAVRERSAGGADCDAALDALFALEEERVANASALAEILLPLLREPVPADAAHTDRSSRSRPVGPEPAIPPGRPPAVPGIADFIDEMIAQERTARRAAAP